MIQIIWIKDLSSQVGHAPLDRHWVWSDDDHISVELGLNQGLGNRFWKINAVSQFYICIFYFLFIIYFVFCIM